MHKILITGATGYLGSSLTSYLYKDCGFDVSVLLRDKERYPNNFDLPDENIFEVDKLRLYSKNKVSFQSIIHCATRYKADRVTELMAANVSFPLEVMDTMLEKDGFFFNVDTSLNPDTNLYAFSKNQFELILKEIAENGGPKIINLELEYFFDENEPRSRFLPSLIGACIKNEDFDLTEGDQIRDFIHIIDLCKAIDILINDRNKFEDNFINVGVGSGNGISIKELANLIKELTNSTSTLNFGKIPYRQNETMHAEANIEILNSLGWVPRFNFTEGLKRTIELSRSNYV